MGASNGALRPKGAVDQSANETIQGIFANLEKEENDMSDTGGNDQNPEWLFNTKKNGQPVDQFGGPGGTGSSSSYQHNRNFQDGGHSKPPIQSYMMDEQANMNLSTNKDKKS